MASINTATKEITCKVVYYGPGMSGKTTNLQMIHQGLPENHRGNLVSLDTQQERTLFFDFLPIDLGTIEGFKTKFQLYTVPGQVYYNATRKLVLRGVDGIIFVADSQPDKADENIESWENLKENLAEYGYKLSEIPHALQYNKRDIFGAMSIEQMNRTLNPEGAIPVIEAVAFKGRGVKDTLKTVASGVLEQIRDKMLSTRPAAPSRQLTPIPSDIAGERKLIDPTKVREHRPMLRRRPDEPMRPAASAPVPAAATATLAPERPAPAPTPASAPRAIPSPPAPALKPAPAPAPVAAEPAPRPVEEPSRVAERRAAAPHRRVYEIDQACEVRWAGLRVGRGRIRISARENFDGEGSHLVRVESRVWGLFRRGLCGPADIAGERRATPTRDDGARFEVSTGNGHRPEVLVEGGSTPRAWLRLGGLRLIPQGERLRSWPRPGEQSSSKSEETAPCAP